MQNEERINGLENQVRILKRIVCLVCCLFGVLMFAGCSGGQDSSSTNFNDWILGKWTNEVGNVTYEFSPDAFFDTFTVTVTKPTSTSTWNCKLVGNKLIAEHSLGDTWEKSFFEVEKNPDSFLLIYQKDYALLMNPKLQLRQRVTFTRVP